MMGKQIFLNLGSGNLQQGFPFVTARLQEGLKTREYAGSLPAARNLVDTYRRWQLLYDLLYKSRSFNIRSSTYESNDEDDDICIDEADITHVSEADFADVCRELQQNLNRWLDSEEFRPLERQLRKQLHPDDEISLIVQTEDNHLRKLPWYVWQFFNDYPKAEVSLGSVNFEPKERYHKGILSPCGTMSPKVGNRRVRVLAILGNSAGINIEQDRQLLANLSGTEVVFLVEPKPQELNEKLWDKPGWDILFFAGHSCSIEDDANGQIFINAEDSLTIPQLKNSLNQAISRGVQLAIFNSCAGLGLAAQLTTLAIPQMIVMREPVPDRVAQEFLKYFLTAYATEQSFSLAVREARERLQGIEADFPGASWLPVIFQNPAEVPPTWEQLKRGINTQSDRPAPSSPIRPKLRTILGSSLVVTGLIMGLRTQGMLQLWELQAFDFLLNQLPPELVDNRILIVGADDKDLDKYGYPLPDRILAKVITKLQQHKPAAIGIDIFRSNPMPENDAEGHQALVDLWQQDANIVNVCFGKELDNNVNPPPQSPPEQIGFNDLYDDQNVTSDRDDSIRRYLLSRSPKTIYQASSCTTDYSFALQLLHRYFQAQNIAVTTIGENWQFGRAIIKPLTTRSGGYQNLDAGGNQLLISYRRIPQIAQQITIRDVLENSNNLDPGWIKNRIVLIGITQQAILNDIHDTPQGEQHGVHIHAHVISQILSAVENNRPLFWYLPQWGDAVLVWFSSLAGGIVIWIWHSPSMRSFGIGGCCTILLGIYWLVMIKGGWLPLVPSAISLGVTGVVAIVLSRFEA
jgi:CHASE2 domain-containing sensor protein